MKTERIFALVLTIIMLFSLASCDKLHVHGNRQNGDENEEKKTIYVYSITQRTLHLPDCYHLERMNEDYRVEYDGDVTELLLKNFTLCKDCFPGEKEDTDDTEIEEEENKISKEDATFLINASSLKLHTLDCYHIEGMNESNIQYTDLSLEKLLELDTYIPCGFCLPDEYEQYLKDHGLDKDSNK